MPPPTVSDWLTDTQCRIMRQWFTIIAKTGRKGEVDLIDVTGGHIVEQPQCLGLVTLLVERRMERPNRRWRAESSKRGVKSFRWDPCRPLEEAEPEERQGPRLWQQRCKRNSKVYPSSNARNPAACSPPDTAVSIFSSASATFSGDRQQITSTGVE
jgi:hypothetical protein